MQIPVKTLKSGFSMPVYGLGTWLMGGAFEADYSRDEHEVAAIKSAIDHGVTHIDTAEKYGAGHAEELVGQAMKGYDRSKLFIATKVAAENQGFEGTLRALERSLERLQTDYVDLYLLHAFPKPGISIGETMRALDKLVDEGTVRHIGVCNMTINRFEEVQKHTQNKLVYNQLHYSLQQREAEKYNLVDYCQQNDIFLTAWAPLEQGAVEAEILDALAKKYNKTPRQVALNWLVSQQNVVTISKTSQAAHLEENLGALNWELSAEDINYLAKEFPNQQTRSPRVPLD